MIPYSHHFIEPKGQFHQGTLTDSVWEFAYAWEYQTAIWQVDFALSFVTFCSACLPSYLHVLFLLSVGKGGKRLLFPTPTPSYDFIVSQSCGISFVLALIRNKWTTTIIVAIFVNYFVLFHSRHICYSMPSHGCILRWFSSMIAFAWLGAPRKQSYAVNRYSKYIDTVDILNQHSAKTVTTAHNAVRTHTQVCEWMNVQIHSSWSSCNTIQSSACYS